MTAFGDGILATLLRSAALVPPGPAGDSRVYTRQVADLADRVPCLVVRTVPGGTALQATVDASRAVPWQLDVYLADSHDGGRAAAALCRSAVRVLVAAARARTVTPDGWLTAVDSVTGPYDAADAGTPGGITRWQATGLLGMRKPF